MWLDRVYCILVNGVVRRAGSGATMNDTKEKSRVRVERQAGALGAYIYDVDLSEIVSPMDFRLIFDALLDHHVICARDQRISPAQHLALTRMLGDIYVQPSVAGMEGFPEIVEVKGTSRLTESWHSDSTHSVRPPRLSILVARRLPEFGNDTMFANQHMAYETLSSAMRHMLDPLRAVHRTADVTDPRYSMTGKVEESTHPVVRSHPNTSRKALYVNSQYTRRFDGMSSEESQPLLQFLYKHSTQPHLTWRHRWRQGDVLIWDNASVQHLVVGDLTQDSNRVLNRTTTLGEEPF
jgi:taurine dioxygenase